MADPLSTSPSASSDALSQTEGHGDILASPRRSMFDGATTLGILGTFILMVIAIGLGGSLTAFVNGAGLLIVVGGTTLLTVASFAWNDITHIGEDLGKTLSLHRRNITKIATDVLRIAIFARQHGILRLQGSILSSLKTEPFFYKGLCMVIDGMPGTEIEPMLRQDVTSRRTQTTRSAGILRRAAEIAPAMGLIGTLIGLVQMLGNLHDPSTIGSGMAVALLTTFYGVCLSNIILGPLASKLDHAANEEALTHWIYLLVILSIERKDNPRRLEMQINSLLPSGIKIQVFD